MSKLNIEVDPSNRQELIEASSMLENLAFRLDNAVIAGPDKADANLDISDKSEIEIEQEIESNMQTEQNHAAELANDATTDLNISAAIQLANGIPWDARIHSGNKSTLAKPPHGWKLKRSVDPALVAEVEAELRAVMSASPEKPIETATATNTGGPTPPAGGPTPPATDKPAPTPQPTMPVKYMVEGTAYTADELKGFNSGWTDENIADLPIAEPEPAAIVETTTTALTWPQMLAKITAAKAEGTITDADVIGACNANGLASIQLAGARPDLQPLIMTALFG